ncbi:COX assembly mitochondrial protein homolog isoform X2 [Canis lupus baileyi]|uniref:COX assembly mitochondrial protein homolog isoform X2 n=1 Tax=Canis lupus baileyi TaxID=143281 RepID=UPI003B974FA1
MILGLWDQAPCWAPYSAQNVLGTPPLCTKAPYFTRCCKDSGILMVVKCRKENSALKECLTAHYNDPAFYEECKMEYLKEREEFRKTGIPSKKRLQKLPTSM